MSFLPKHQFVFEMPTIWHMIVGHKYINVLSRNMTYGEMLMRLRDEMGDDFVKPITLVNLAQFYKTEDALPHELELYDYDFS